MPSPNRSAPMHPRPGGPTVWICLLIPAALLGAFSLVSRLAPRQSAPPDESATPPAARQAAPSPHASLFAPAASLPNEWTRRIAAYDRAATAGDRATLLRLMEGAGRFIDVHGDVWDRQGYADRLIREGAKVTEALSSAQGLRVFGTVAIESGTRETVQRTNNRSMRWQSRYTRIWLRNRKGWTLWTEQSTALPFRPAAK